MFLTIIEDLTSLWNSEFYQEDLSFPYQATKTINFKTILRIQGHEVEALLLHKLERQDARGKEALATFLARSKEDTVTPAVGAIFLQNSKSH